MTFTDGGIAISSIPVLAKAWFPISNRLLGSFTFFNFTQPAKTLFAMYLHPSSKMTSSRLVQLSKTLFHMPITGFPFIDDGITIVESSNPLYYVIKAYPSSSSV